MLLLISWPPCTLSLSPSPFTAYSYEFSCVPSTSYFLDSNNKCAAVLPVYDVSDGIRYAVFAVSAVCLAWIGVHFVAIVIHWNAPLYRAASRPFLLLTLIFLAAMALGALLYAAIPEPGSNGNAVCVGRAWLSCLPLAGILSILFAKCNRVDHIFGSMTLLKAKNVSDMSIVKFILSFCSIETIFLLVFSFIPLSEPRLDTGSGTLNTYLVQSCSLDSDGMAWLGVQIAFFAVLMFAAGALAFRTRNLPSAFSQDTHGAHIKHTNWGNMLPMRVQTRKTKLTLFSYFCTHFHLCSCLSLSSLFFSDESAHIANCLMVQIFFGVLIIPLTLYTHHNPESAILLQGLGQCFLVAMMTSILFGPKLYIVLTTDTAGQKMMMSQASPNGVGPPAGTSQTTSFTPTAGPSRTVRPPISTFGRGANTSPVLTPKPIVTPRSMKLPILQSNPAIAPPPPPVVPSNRPAEDRIDEVGESTASSLASSMGQFDGVELAHIDKAGSLLHRELGSSSTPPPELADDMVDPPSIVNLPSPNAATTQSSASGALWRPKQRLELALAPIAADAPTIE